MLFLSGTCWSSYHKGLLASSDYEGTVTLWDAFTGVKNRSFQVCLWCGVVWCGVVWCGVVWCGVVWCGVVWCGVVWCGVVLYGMVWYGHYRWYSHDTVYGGYEIVWYSYGMVHVIMVCEMMCYIMWMT